MNGDLVVFTAAIAAVSFVVGMEFPKAPACPEELQDGRVLLSHTFNGKETRCKYAPPKSQYELSPAELRRMASAKERLAKVK